MDFGGGISGRLQLAIILILQTILIILFGIFVRYGSVEGPDKKQDGSNKTVPEFNSLHQYYPMFQDVHVMIFVGFGFLMTFLRRYGYSAIGFNLLFAAIMIQWGILCDGFFDLGSNRKINISISRLLAADVSTAAALISMGAVLGKTTYLQLIVMGFIELIICKSNEILGVKVYKAVDAGGSIFIHTFGAYFGLAVSFALRPKRGSSVADNNLEGASYTSDLFSMIGTIFLWMFWPSFNAANLEGDEQHRAVINTYLALASCTVVVFIMSALLSNELKFEMAHIQNATLAGGVAIGTSGNMMVQPFGALLIGAVAGILSVVGFKYIQPWLLDRLRLHDTCGVHNLHGMPGVLAGLFSALFSLIATAGIDTSDPIDTRSSDYTLISIYKLWPARTPPAETGSKLADFARAAMPPGDGRTAASQALYQLLALLTTLVIAIAAGLITGYLLRIPIAGSVPDKYKFADIHNWELPEEEKPNETISISTVEETRQGVS